MNIIDIEMRGWKTIFSIYIFHNGLPVLKTSLKEAGENRFL